MKNILYDIYRRNLVPVYRFANEGFVNYTQRDYTIKIKRKSLLEFPEGSSLVYQSTE